MSAKIIIIGTCHSLQCGAGKPDQINSYKNFIYEKCTLHNVKVIAEEMSEEGLSNHGISTTIAKELVQGMKDIEHHYIDIPIEEKRLLKIDNDSLAVYSEFRFTKRNKNNDKLERLRKIISNPVREICWFTGLLDINIWPAMFVCGENHVDNMRRLIQKADRHAFVCAYHGSAYLE